MIEIHDDAKITKKKNELIINSVYNFVVFNRFSDPLNQF